MKKIEQISGVVKRHPDGFGFLIPDEPEQPDLFLPPKEMKNVMTSDRVTAQARKERRGKRFFGVEVKILQRGITRVVGKVRKQGKSSFQIFDGISKWGTILEIPMNSSKGAADGDLVVVDIVGYPSKNTKFTGQVVEIIGDEQDPNTDIQRVLHEHHVPMEFPSDVLNEAKDIPEKVLPEDHQKRKDLRNLAFITIDGVTAKDFDDAIHVERKEKGFHLRVAIADVSHYVRPKSAIDKEAFQRGTSVYLPNFVVPMLPEKLSNGICSLKPEVDRLAFVCEMEIDPDGNVHRSKAFEAVICSQARITYKEAQEIINGNQTHHKKAVQENISLACELAKILMNKRHQEGTLDLEIPETEVVVNDLGETVDVIRSERLFAHKLIEEMMLVANVSVAKMIQRKKQASLFRVHPPPNAEDIDRLQVFLSQFGSQVKLRGKNLQKKLSQSLQDFQSKPQAMVLNILTLRSMNQATYDKTNIGHFGLGFCDYTHFTSPIRRYPDLIIHRILKKLFVSSPSGCLYSEEDLTGFGTILSAAEQRAIKAERQVMNIKKARFISERIGETFGGIVSGVTQFGLFVLLREFDIDGLVKVEDLGGDRFDFDPVNGILTGKKTGRIYKMGDPLKVIVEAVDTIQGRIDFLLTEKPSTKKKKSRKTKDKGSPKDRRLSKDKRSSKNKGSLKGRRSSKNKGSLKGRRSSKNKGSLKGRRSSKNKGFKR